jgi:hypothetical protein
MILLSFLMIGYPLIQGYTFQESGRDLQVTHDPAFTAFRSAEIGEDSINLYEVHCQAHGHSEAESSTLLDLIF